MKPQGNDRFPDNPLADGLTRRHALRLGVGAVTVAALPPFLAACGSESSTTGGADAVAQLQENGVKLGVPNFLPSTGIIDGEAAGVFPEATTAVFNEMGVSNVEALDMAFDSVIPSLQAGRIDVAPAGMAIYSDRCDVMDFSDPILCYLHSMAVREGNPHNLRTYKDVAEAGVNLGVEAGSQEVILAKQAGVPEDKTSNFPDLQSMFDALEAGRVDAIGESNTAVDYYVNQEGRSGIEGTEPYEVYSCAAVGFQQGSEELVDEFNTTLKRMRDEGALDPIFEKWSIADVNLSPAKDYSTDQLCQIASDDPLPPR